MSFDPLVTFAMFTGCSEVMSDKKPPAGSRTTFIADDGSTIEYIDLENTYVSDTSASDGKSVFTALQVGYVNLIVLFIKMLDFFFNATFVLPL